MPVTDPNSARVLVYNVVVGWLASAVNLPQTSIDVSRKFMGAPTGGYGLNEGRFLQMCDDITAALNNATARTLKLPGQWRVQHENDVISAFINAVAVKLIAASMTAAGQKAHTWAMS
jgi:hypothetical protein